MPPLHVIQPWHAGIPHCRAVCGVCVAPRTDRFFFFGTQDARHLAAQQAQVAAARVAREERANRAAQGRRGILRSRGEVTRAELGQRYSEREKCPYRMYYM